MSLTKKWKLKTKPVDAVYLTEENYREVAEWCGGKVANGSDFIGNYDVPCITVPTIGTGGPKMHLVPTLAVSGKDVIFQNRHGYFVVITNEQFEELWEPVEDLQGMYKQPDEAEEIAFDNDRIRPLDTLVDN